MPRLARGETNTHTHTHLVRQQVSVGEAGLLLHDFPQHDPEAVDVALLAEPGAGQHFSRRPRQLLLGLLVRALFALEVVDQLGRRGQAGPVDLMKGWEYETFVLEVIASANWRKCARRGKRSRAWLSAMFVPTTAVKREHMRPCHTH